MKKIQLEFYGGPLDGETKEHSEYTREGMKLLIPAAERGTPGFVQHVYEVVEYVDNGMTCNKYVYRGKRK